MMESIKKIFFSYNSKYRPVDMPEVKAALIELNMFLEKNMNYENFSAAEALSSELYIRSEMQGFVYGFQYAMRIAAECWVDIPDQVKNSDNIPQQFKNEPCL